MALTTTHKVALSVALIGAFGSILGATIPGLIPPIYDLIHDNRPKRYVNGVVTDAVTRAPMPGVVVKLETNEGRLLTQDTTDHDGKFNLPISENIAGIRVIAVVDGYVPYDEKLPAQETRNDIALVRQLLSQGIPDGTPLDDALRIVSSKINVTTVFSKNCTKTAMTAAINGGQIEGDTRIPAEMVKALISRIKDNTSRYDVITIEEGIRYEIRCF